MKRNFYDDRDSGLVYLLVLTVPIILGIMLSLFFEAIAFKYGANNLLENPAFKAPFIALTSFILLAIFLIYNKKQKIETSKASLFKIKFGWKNLFLCIIIAVVTLFGFNTLINCLFHLFEKIGYVPDTDLPLPLDNGWWLTINLVVLAVIPAIFEELIYRGIIFNGLRKFGNVKAIILSALFFALAHGSAVQLFYQLILGVVLALVVIRTGSIVASIVIHFLNNAMVIIYSYVVSPGLDSQTFSANGIVFAFVMAIASTGLLILLIFGLKEKKDSQISYNNEYNDMYIQKRGFSDDKSRLILGIACGIAAVFWIFGTFF